MNQVPAHITAFREIHAHIEAFQVTEEIAIGLLADKKPLPWGLEHGSASWHRVRRTVWEMTVPLGNNRIARLGDWVIRWRDGKLESRSNDDFAKEFQADIIPLAPEVSGEANKPLKELFVGKLAWNEMDDSGNHFWRAYSHVDARRAIVGGIAHCIHFVELPKGWTPPQPPSAQPGARELKPGDADPGCSYCRGSNIIDGDPPEPCHCSQMEPIERDMWTFRNKGNLQESHNAASDESAVRIGWRKTRVREVPAATAPENP